MDALDILHQAQASAQPAVETPKPEIIRVRRVEVLPPQSALPAVYQPQLKGKKPRKAGLGYLYSRGRKGLFWFEFHHEGRRYREPLGTADRETAKDKMQERIKEITTGIPRKKYTPVSVQEMFENWIKQVEVDCKPRTVEDYRARWTKHLAPVFGKLMATQVSSQAVTDYLNKRMKQGAHPITQNREQRVLMMIFNHNKALIPPTHSPEFPSLKSEAGFVRKGTLAPKDYNTLLTRLEEPKLFWLRALLTLAFKFGFRKGELINAKVNWFNPETSKFILPAYSTKNSREREVTIKKDGEIYQMLVQLTKGRGKDEPLLTRNGRAIKDFRGAWDKLTEGITNGRGERVTVHDLRRSAITAMNEKGIGAADAGTHLTADIFRRYIQQTETRKQEVAGMIERD